MNRNIGICLMIASSISSVVSVSVNPGSGIRPSNILGGAGQHASFDFIRPGLTQTSYSFNGPSSHQSFSSSIGNPLLAQKVLPNVAQALAYRNPGLDYQPQIRPELFQYSQFPSRASPDAGAVYQHSLLNQQYQQQQQINNNYYQNQLAQILALRQAQLTSIENAPEPVQQAPVEHQNLLGVAYSPSNAVSHVKISANGYKYDF
ncbi:GSCOCG00004419001-RA-CDS [Cotesia congregata]|nr:GSCOCG00004419001-RA-CDS [Cotesia congregata]